MLLIDVCNVDTGSIAIEASAHEKASLLYVVLTVACALCSISECSQGAKASCRDFSGEA